MGQICQITLYMGQWVIWVSGVDLVATLIHTPHYIVMGTILKISFMITVIGNVCLFRYQQISFNHAKTLNLCVLSMKFRNFESKILIFYGIDDN